MKPLNRLLQFSLIYGCGLGLLLALKFLYGLSDYLVPPPAEILAVFSENWRRYLCAVLDTTFIAIAGHGCAIFLAAAVALIGSTRSTMGAMTRTAAYNLQAYPVVAIAPILFIFLGDGVTSRLLIASLICYFPLLLSFIGVFIQPVDEVEHFFASTGRLTWWRAMGIRTHENMGKITTVIAGSGTMAMVGSIVAEFLAATAGIGYIIRKALYQSDLARILAALFFIGLFSSLYISLLELMGTRILKRLSVQELPSR